MLLLMFGAALLYGDGCITPAISVLSAVEGLEGFAPQLTAFVLPITLAILLVLFAVQRFGTGEKLVLWTLLDTGLRVSELRSLTP